MNCSLCEKVHHTYYQLGEKRICDACVRVLPPYVEKEKERITLRASYEVACKFHSETLELLTKRNHCGCD